MTTGPDVTPKVQNSRRDKNMGTSDDTELQKAIALSLAEQPQQQQQQQQTPLGLGGQVSAEEQELSRVIEASIAESKKGAAVHDLRQSSLFFVDPPNPHERERNGCWPVGLKNVGNTCWFSVVVQALFHLPVFRRHLMSYDVQSALQACHPPEAAATSSAAASPSTVPRELEFAMEMRKLFALFWGSRRKYVDPSGAVDVLRKQDSLQLRNIGGLDCGQQDVSEFTHLLLEWLEEAFKLTWPTLPASPACKTTPMKVEEEQTQQRVKEIEPNSINPIQQLFYGTFVVESSSNIVSPPPAHDTANQAGDRNPGASLDVQMVPATKEERFSQYPLQVVGLESLHDSMEKSLCPEESSDVENWLEVLPPVFLFELTRFQYNQIDQKPEKIHSKFRFPKVLYVDRYLRENKVAIREKRGHVRRLRQQLNTLKYELEKLENYHGSKMPLSNVLALTLEFLGRGDEARNASGERMDGCDPVGGDGNGQVMQQTFLRNLTNATDEEMETMKRCLDGWRAQVLQHIEELKNQVRQVEEQIESVYQEPIFQQHPYMLHAVLVHEGQATLGHYWTFIHDRKVNKWLKFNDVQVTEVSYEEVERDSVGGYQSTSAYCLVYVDGQRSDLFDGPENINETLLVSSLPLDLQRFVVEDNSRFMAEVAEWDNKHAAASTVVPAAAAAATGTTKTAQAVTSPITTAAQSPAGPRTPGQGGLSETELADLVQDLQRLGARHVHRYMQAILETVGTDVASPEDAFNKLVEDKIKRVAKEGEEFLIRNGFSNGVIPKWHVCFDQRISNWLPFYAYCWMHCNIGKIQPAYDETRVLHRIVLDYFANNVLVGQNATESMTAVYQMAKRAIANFGEWTPSEQNIYMRICIDFKMYLETLVLLAYALEKLHDGRYLPALHGLLCAKSYADRLSQSSNRAGGVDFDLVLSCYRVIAMHLSEQTIKMLSTNDDNEVVEKVKLMKAHLLPSLVELFHRHNDTDTLETVRASWFAAVVDERHVLSDVKQRELRDFLDALMEVEMMTEGANRQAMNAKITLQPDVGNRFVVMLSRAREQNILQCTHSDGGGEKSQ